MLENEFLSPQKVAELLKVSCSTIKRWVDEGRLGAMKTIGGHRKINAWDVLKIAQAQGWSHINIDAIRPFVSKDKSVASCDTACMQLYEGIRAGDSDKVRTSLVEAYRSGIGIAEIGDRIVMPAMHSLGEDWDRGVLDICQEHHATHSVLTALMEVRQRIFAAVKPESDAPLAMGCAPEGDHYFIPTLLVEMVFMENRWKVKNYGPNTPIESLKLRVKEKKPRMVWVSGTFVRDSATLEKELMELNQVMGEWKADLLVGGQGIEPEMVSRLGLNWRGKSLGEMVGYMRSVLPTYQAPRPGRPPHHLE